MLTDKARADLHDVLDCAGRADTRNFPGIESGTRFMVAWGHTPDNKTCQFVHVGPHPGRWPNHPAVRANGMHLSTSGDAYLRPANSPPRPPSHWLALFLVLLAEGAPFAEALAQFAKIPAFCKHCLWLPGQEALGGVNTVRLLASRCAPPEPEPDPHRLRELAAAVQDEE